MLYNGLIGLCILSKHYVERAGLEPAIPGSKASGFPVSLPPHGVFGGLSCR